MQQEDLAFELERLVPWRQGLAAPQHLFEQDLVKLMRLLFVGPRQGGAAETLEPMW
jgi:hypothetical protein